MNKKVIISIITICIVFIAILLIRRVILINKFLNFSLSKLDSFYIEEKRYDTNNELYNLTSVYKYNENWHYIINNKDIYLNDNSNEMTIINNGEKTIQEKSNLENMVQLYSDYLGWDSKNVFEKINYIITVNIKSTKYNNQSVYKVSTKNDIWYLSKENYSPIEFKDISYISKFEYSEKVNIEEVILSE